MSTLCLRATSCVERSTHYGSYDVCDLTTFDSDVTAAIKNITHNNDSCNLIREVEHDFAWEGIIVGLAVLASLDRIEALTKMLEPSEALHFPFHASQRLVPTCSHEAWILFDRIRCAIIRTMDSKGGHHQKDVIKGIVVEELKKLLSEWYQ